ncbi:hypothetical protein DQ04_01081100 [Trypanosoma grayi]|uniref:hypothetical protein n=1 Tax=Trypanosoma grayi TaxID=71804 RepID=UPI0004F48FCD|nr:hypothetical protein DQ04_01081100 [Trypanosoma grayi]KEG13317.1 hypothetical protein DQ04_01081100 [Trypanosoma grayi]
MRHCLLVRVRSVLPSTLHVGKGALPSHPPAAPPKVDTNAEAYRRMAHELTLLSADEFSRRLYRFSKTNFDQSQTGAVHAHVTELMCRRLREVSNKCIREYAHLAHAAKLHELCLEVYYARAALMAASAATDGDDVAAGGFVVSDAVVDSAYSLARTADLRRLASHCVKHLQQVPSMGWEVMSAFSLVRAFWRCVCIATNHSSTHTVEGKQAIQDAAYIYDECITAVYPGPCQELMAQDAVRIVQRFVQYASCGDEGEMLFFHFCLQRGFLRKPRDTVRQDDGSGTLSTIVSNGSAGNGAEGNVVSEEQWFYASLIATCRVGQHVDVALRYFDDICTFLGIEQVSSGDLLRPRARRIQDGTHTAEQAGETKAANSRSVEQVSEFLIFQLLTVLQNAKENGKMVFIARAMLRDGAQLGIGVWSIVLIAAGETRAVDLALAAFAQARHALVESAQTVDRRGNEYLLQTSIHALSKCQVPRFEEDYLRPCQEQSLMHCTNEFYFCVLLQHAHNSTDPAAGAEEVLHAIKEKGTPFTTRIVSRLMKIYLRVESPKLLELYQHATQRLGLFKSSWLDELLLWADRRRYDLTQEQRKYILDEVQRVHGTKGAEGDIGGLRTQYALLRYDYEHDPLNAFSQTSQPQVAEPTMMDSRVHFLIKKPHCVNHYAAEQRRNNAVASCALVGDPERRQRVVRSALLANEGVTVASGDVRPEEFRVYMGSLIEALQRTNNCIS